MKTRRVLRRLLTVVFAVAVVITGLIAAQRSVAATMAVVGGMLVVGVFLWWRRQRDVASSVVALVLSCGTTGYVTEWGAQVAGTGRGQTVGVAFWIFAGVVTIASWMVRQHPGSRGATVAMANAVLIVVSPLTAVSPETAALLGLAGAMGIVAWRGGGWLSLQRWWWRRRPLEQDSSESERDANVPLAESLRGANHTARALQRLGDNWRVLGSRQFDSNGPAIDHVLLSPSHTLLLYTRAWSGRLSLVTPEDDETEARYGIDGDPAQLGERLRPIVTAAREVRLRLDEDGDTLWSVVVFWDNTRLPQRWLELDLFNEQGRGQDPIRVVLVRGEHLLRWVDEFPALEDGDGLERRLRVAARMLRPTVQHPT